MSIVPERLAETRDFLGFSVAQAAQAAHIGAGRLAAIEQGEAEPTDGEVVALGSLYRRPRWWLEGETRWQPNADLRAFAERRGLSDGDVGVVYYFAEWLADSGEPRARRTAQRWVQPSAGWRPADGDMHIHRPAGAGPVEHGHAGGSIPHAHGRNGEYLRVPACPVCGSGVRAVRRLMNDQPCTSPWHGA